MSKWHTIINRCKYLLGMGRKYKCPMKLPNGSMCGFECGTQSEAVEHNIQWHMGMVSEDEEIEF